MVFQVIPDEIIIITSLQVVAHILDILWTISEYNSNTLSSLIFGYLKMLQS